MLGADIKDLHAVYLQVGDKILKQVFRQRQPAQTDLGCNLPSGSCTDERDVSLLMDRRMRSFGKMRIVRHPPDQRMRVQQ